MCYLDCKQPKVSELTYPKARKQYECCECSSQIDPGEQYECTKGLWDGEWRIYRTCIICAKIKDRAMFELPNDVCIPFGQLYECVGYDYEEEVV